MFMFSPYRFATLPHLQVLSSQWMPLALYGLRRYFVTGRRVALVGSAGAVLLQNLSSGYYLIYFAPIVALYAIVEVWWRGLVRQGRVWRDLVIVGAATLALTLPFAIPYILFQRRINYRRPIPEVEAYSADLLAWLTADAHMNVWGWLQAFPRNEGFLFPGFVIVVLAIVGVIVAGRAEGMPLPESRDPTRHIVALFAILAAVLAMWMAMGPSPTIAGRPLPIPALYRFFYEYVPGFDVSRVPARFTTIIVLLLAMAAAYGASWLDLTQRHALLGLTAIGVLLDGAALPMNRNLPFTTSADVRPPEARIYPERDAPIAWLYAKTLPPDAVLAHLPFGYPEHELRYLYYSLVDGHRISNGYSGAFPLSYQTRTTVLQRAIEMPAQAVARLREDGVNYVVVHTERWPGDVGMRTVMTLEGAGLRPVTHLGTVYVLEVSR